MGKKIKAGCGAPKMAKHMPEEGVIIPESKSEEEVQSMIMVGKPAPGFTMQGYHKGEFKQFSLSEFAGKWVLLCFYPGDFTFV